VKRKLAELQAQFDTSFARPAALGAEERVALLRLRVGGVALAVPLESLCGLHLMPRVVPLPAGPPGLLGLLGLRGQLVAVHDLAACLGLPAGGAPRWLALCGPRRDVGLAVEVFEGQVRVAPEQVRPHTEGEPSRPYLHASVLLPDAPPLPLVDVDSLVQALLDGAAAPRIAR
jgi:purine-binding chemotaxis protein CheW